VSELAQKRPVTGAEARRRRPARPTGRIAADGRFLELAGGPFRVRGVTYGSFRPRADGEPFPESRRVRRDFEAIADAGLNTVRTYSLPPVDVLELAEEAGLRLLVGLHYEDWRYAARTGRAATRRVRDAGLRAVDDALERCGDRAGVIALSVGNEVPGDLVRLNGIGAVAGTLSALIERVHDAGTGLLATYTNYPTTEYLPVEGQDLVSFNVFLEEPAAFRRYLRRLQVVAGDRPLLVSELGCPSELSGRHEQAELLASQLRLVDEAGCAGATVFSWTDEWGVDGVSVGGWGFGITDADREPKPALEAVAAWAGSDVRDLRDEWPSVSVVVCARNEEAIVERCLASLARCDYPGLEVVFCDDGSTDRTLELARRFPFTVLALEHGGLSAARNAGIEASRGDIVAFLDADAECHPEWPYHLALSLDDAGVVATGGPNLSPPDAPFVERAVGLSPGVPLHVLVSDDRAEHVPGCNMAFRREALDEIGGFDPAYTSAGDDVDVCWKILDRGGQIAFAPAAQVRHHRPSSVRVYLRQQRSYGRAERMLAGAHRHRFNTLGQARWAGFIYGGARLFPSLLRPVVYHGPMGMAPFQMVVDRRPERALARAAPLVPLAVPVALLGALAVLSPWFLLAPAAAVACLLAYGLGVALAMRPDRTEPSPAKLRALVGFLHVAQPFARTWGRLRGRPVRVRRPEREAWTGDRAAWLETLRRALARRGCSVRGGVAHDGWDLAASVGPFVSCRVTTAVAWSWTPLRRLELRPRPQAFAALALAAAAAAFDPLLGGALVALVATSALVEAVVLSGRVRDALSHTTAGSEVRER
jgi:GT2 family glycosyltransferase